MKIAERERERERKLREKSEKSTIVSVASSFRAKLITGTIYKKLNISEREKEILGENRKNQTIVSMTSSFRAKPITGTIYKEIKRTDDQFVPPELNTSTIAVNAPQDKSQNLKAKL